jgi:hypothetical protein
MAKCTITFLFDTGQVFQESWELAEGHGDPLPVRLKRIAQARLPLLAACVRVVQLKAQGHPLERVDLRGTGGAFAHPRYALKLADDGYSTGIFLRGVPREVYAKEALTPSGMVAFRALNTVLTQCGCAIVRNGQARPVTKLGPTRQTLFSYRKDKKATLRKLVSILGEEKAQQFWAELKKKRLDQKPLTGTPVLAGR